MKRHKTISYEFIFLEPINELVKINFIYLDIQFLLVLEQATIKLKSNLLHRK